MIVRVYNFLSEEKPKFSQNLVGIVSDVTSFKYTRRAYDIGSFEMVIPTHADETDCIQPDRMLIVGDKIQQTYIESDPTKRIVRGMFLYVTDIEKKDDKITVTGYDLKYLFALRVTLFPKEEQDKGTYGYYVTSGTTFSCISDIINYNIVNATDSDRQIYGMFGITMPVNQINADPPLTGIQDDRYMTRLEPVSTAIFNLLKNCKTHFYDMRLIIDDNAEDGDSYNPHMESSEDKPVIIIDESRYNIKSYARKDGTSAYKNAIYAVVGSGDAVTVKCVKRPDDTASGVKRKEVVLDVDTDSVSEIDRYALKAAEEYVISDDFEIEPLFMDDETEPELAQKVSIRIDGVEYETVITEITDEYANGKHTQSYVCGDKKLKVLNVLNKATAGNTQKIINNKINANSNAAIYNDPVIISQDTANYLEYKYEIVDYYAGDIVTFGQSGNPIIVQGNPVYKDAPTELFSGLTSSVAFNEYSESYNLDKISYDKDGNETGRTYKQTISCLKNGEWNTYVYTRSCAAGVEYLLRVTYDEICSPSDDYPYGCALIHTYGYTTVRSLDMSTAKTYCAFSSAEEYNAALNLTKSTLKKQSVSQTAIKSENYDSSANLPQIGVPDTIYTTTEPAAVWRYDSKNKKYVCVGRDYNEINEIKSDIYGADEAGAMKLPVRQLTKSTEEWKADSTIYPRGMMLIAQDIETELGRRKSVIRIANGIDTWSDLSDTNYLPIAASDTIGGVMIGDNISVTADGMISVDLSAYLQSADIADWAKQAEKPLYTAGEVGAAAKKHTHNVSDITDMPEWAKAKNKPSYTADEVGAAAKSHTHTKSQITDFPAIPTKVSELQNDSGYISEETDPTVPAWAKADKKPTYTASEVGAATSDDVTAAINAAEIGGTQILKGTNTVTVLGSQSYKSPWKNGGWRAASGGTGTRESIAITDAPEANIKLGWELTQSAGALDICQDDIPIASGQTYTVSCYARGTGRLRINCGKNPYRAKYFDFDNAGGWIKCANTFVASEATTGSASEINVYFGNVSAGALQICGMKLETGIKATGWNEAPISVEARQSDLEARVAALEAAALAGGE